MILSICEFVSFVSPPPPHLREFARSSKVDEVQHPGVRIIQKVAPVRVRLNGRVSGKWVQGINERCSICVSTSYKKLPQFRPI